MRDSRSGAEESREMILDKLKRDEVLGDGGMIFELERRGYVRAGPYTPEVVIEYPQVVRQLHVDFARGGSEVLQACSYYTDYSSAGVHELRKA